MFVVLIVVYIYFFIIPKVHDIQHVCMYVDKVCIFLFIFYNTEGSGVLRDFGTWWLLISGGSFKYVIPILFYPYLNSNKICNAPVHMYAVRARTCYASYFF